MHSPPMPLPNGELVDTPTAARILGKSATTIRQYASRGVRLPNGDRYILRPAGLDGRGHQLYRLADLAVIRHATTARGTDPRAVIAA